MANGILGRVLALAAVVLIAAVGFCLLEVDHGIGGDPCTAALVMSIGLFAAFSLIPIGSLRPAVATAYRFYPGDLPAPPPKA